MEFDYQLFCTRITELRNKRGYNKYEMAIQADINYQYYCDIENGNSIPNFKAAISIANALKTNLSHLLDSRYSNECEEMKIVIMSKVKLIKNKDLLQKYQELIKMLKTQVDLENDRI